MSGYDSLHWERNFSHLLMLAINSWTTIRIDIATADWGKLYKLLYVVLLDFFFGDDIAVKTLIH